MIKIAPALAAAAVMLSPAMAKLQCSMPSAANIEYIEVISAADLADKYPRLGGANYWADVTLTEDYHPDRDISEATHHITMRHNGIDCRQISKAKHNMCNKGYVEEEGGNSCAQVTSRAHRIGFETGKAVDIAQNSPNQSVHFSAALSSSLNYWTAGVVNTCGMQMFDAPDKGYKTLTFSASTQHKWDLVRVVLDNPDEQFGYYYACQKSEDQFSTRPRVYTDDNQTFTITNIEFLPLLK